MNEKLLFGKIDEQQLPEEEKNGELGLKPLMGVSSLRKFYFIL